MLRFFSRLLRPRWFRLALLLVAVAFLVFPFIVIEWGRSHVYLPDSTIPPHDVAIVFGASVRRDGSPSIMLRDRLIKAADLYRDQVVQKILVSGHNAKDGYNEPEGMYQYLISKEMIPADDVVRDYAVAARTTPAFAPSKSGACRRQCLLLRVTISPEHSIRVRSLA